MRSTGASFPSLAFPGPGAPSPGQPLGHSHAASIVWPVSQSVSQSYQSSLGLWPALRCDKAGPIQDFAFHPNPWVPTPTPVLLPGPSARQRVPTCSAAQTPIQTAGSWAGTI